MRITRENFSDGISEELYDRFIRTLRQHLLNGDTIVLKNVGTLVPVNKPGGKKKMFGEEVKLEESVKLKFKQSRNFKTNLKKLKSTNPMEHLIDLMKDD